MNFVGIFIITIVMFGLIMIFFSALNQAYSLEYDFAKNQTVRADSVRTQNLLDKVWLYLPLAMFFSFIIYIVNHAKRDGEYK